MFFDLGLVYDRDARACDLRIGPDGDFVVDETPVTAILLSVGLDGRAEPDDELPSGRSDFLKPSSLSVRRGGPSDALDPAGERAGSRLWLLDRAKECEATRLLFQFWLEEALAWAARETGTPAEIEVAFIRASTLAWRVLVADDAVSSTRTLT